MIEAANITWPQVRASRAPKGAIERISFAWFDNNEILFQRVSVGPYNEVFATYVLIHPTDERGEIDAQRFKDEGPRLQVRGYQPTEIRLLAAIHKEWPFTHHDITEKRRGRSCNIFACRENLLVKLRETINRAAWIGPLLESLPSASTGGQPITALVSLVNDKRNELVATEAALNRGSELHGHVERHYWNHTAWAHIRNNPEPAGTTKMTPEVEAHKAAFYYLNRNTGGFGWEDRRYEASTFRGEWYIWSPEDTLTTASRETLNALMEEFDEVPPDLLDEEKPPVDLDAIIESVIDEEPA